MSEELAKQNGKTLTFQKQPEKFLLQVGKILETFQKVYRQNLPADELVMWRETLKDYCVEEFQDALSHLVRNPPKYMVGDEIQVWRGLPKLPDVVNVMLDKREERAAEYRRQESQRLTAEMKELEKQREANPEKFFGWNDLKKDFAERLLGKKL